MRKKMAGRCPGNIQFDLVFLRDAATVITGPLVSLSPAPGESSLQRYVVNLVPQPPALMASWLTAGVSFNAGVVTFNASRMFRVFRGTMPAAVDTHFIAGTGGTYYMIEEPEETARVLIDWMDKHPTQRGRAAA
ncbi:MAG: hypothetical protein ACU84Q_16030 [Gammaproteobacteria bacterium]